MKKVLLSATRTLVLFGIFHSAIFLSAGHSATTAYPVRMPTNFISPCQKEDNFTGMHTQYYDDGNVYMKTQCANGIKEGVSLKFYPENILWEEKNYSQDQLEGNQKEYYRDGSLKKEENYQQGKRNGLQTVFHASGQLASEQVYAAGNATGPLKNYDITGALSQLEKFGDKKIMRDVPVTKTNSAVQSLEGKRPQEIKQINNILKYEPYLKNVVYPKTLVEKGSLK